MENGQTSPDVNNPLPPISPIGTPKGKAKLSLTVLIVAAIVAIIGFLGFVIVFMNAQNTSGTNACTMEAKVCPDGSYVGRSGPNCEFDPCPGENNQGTEPTPQTPADLSEPRILPNVETPEGAEQPET